MLKHALRHEIVTKREQMLEERVRVLSERLRIDVTDVKKESALTILECISGNLALWEAIRNLQGLAVRVRITPYGLNGPVILSDDTNELRIGPCTTREELIEALTEKTK